MARKKLSLRAERREQARSLDKLARDRQKLARLEAGGSPENPVLVDSASQVEPHALASTCLRCDGELRLVEHAAVTVGGDRLRVARMACARCGTPREIWLRIAPRLPS